MGSATPRNPISRRKTGIGRDDAVAASVSGLVSSWDCPFGPWDRTFYIEVDWHHGDRAGRDHLDNRPAAEASPTAGAGAAVPAASLAPRGARAVDRRALPGRPEGRPGGGRAGRGDRGGRPAQRAGL